MKYVIIGSTGNTSKPISEALVKAGHEVTVLTSHDKNKGVIEAMGAKAAVGSVEDVDFLKATFAGADAVYTMVPPNFGAKDWVSWIEQIGNNYAEALKTAGVKYVVNLSSIGANLAEGVGPVTGLHRCEIALNSLAGVNIKHLRAGYFYQNLLSNAGLIKTAGIMGSNFAMHDKKFALVDPTDIAAVAVKELSALTFKGHTIEYIVSDVASTNEVATEIGKAIGKPELPWVQFSDEQAYQGMTQAGLSEEIAKNYVEMGSCLGSGLMSEDYFAHGEPEVRGKVRLSDFAAAFKDAYDA